MEIKVLVNGREVHSTEIEKSYWAEYSELRNNMSRLVGQSPGDVIHSDEVLLQKLYNKIHGIN